MTRHEFSQNESIGICDMHPHTSSLDCVEASNTSRNHAGASSSACVCVWCVHASLTCYIFCTPPTPNTTKETHEEMPKQSKVQRAAQPLRGTLWFEGQFGAFPIDGVNLVQRGVNVREGSQVQSSCARHKQDVISPPLSCTCLVGT
jgi:hypothetical protein